mmetsp:Transcript_31860/g.95115  ORF Transcript_31860/g.95115 Transcript_31860/m.95115 type:complete len:210 (-) Transcript_31860:949-1578(-)
MPCSTALCSTPPWPNLWMRCTTERCSWRPWERSLTSPLSQGWRSASLAVGRFDGSRCSRLATNILASSEMPFHAWPRMSSSSDRIDPQMALRRALRGFLWSSNGILPVSSSAAITPMLQRSLAGVTLWLSTSGAMYHGVPSSPSVEMGSPSGSNGVARPKSIALSGERSESLSSMKFPGLISRCRMWWLCITATVRSTPRRNDATVRSE